MTTNNINDVVMTPVPVAKDIIQYFSPKGRILDPCKGDGAFFNNLPEGSDWCEITEGKCFFSNEEKYDWIVSNPPYSIFDKWLVHSLNVADNIVYLIPVNKLLSSLVKLKKVYAFGGIRHIRYYGTGRSIGFPFGFPVGAIHLQKHYKGDISISWYNEIINS